MSGDAAWSSLVRGGYENERNSICDHHLDLDRTCVPQPLHADVAADLRLNYADDCARQVQRLDDGVQVGRSALSACFEAFGYDQSPENMFNLGMVLHALERYEQALKMFERAARQNSADAQNMVGIMHLNGQAVPQSDAEAARWFRKAAEQNLPMAQHYLGLMYALGSGVSKDDAEAVRWFARAAEQGLPEAQWGLGTMYEHGRGLRQDYARAVSLYRQAGESGHAARSSSEPPSLPIAPRQRQRMGPANGGAGAGPISSTRIRQTSRPGVVSPAEPSA